MPATTKDIARETGLSHSTVSRVLNAVPGQRIAEETRQRVLEVAQRLEYQPNAIARSLREGRTNVVGFYGGFNAVNVRKDFDGTIVGGLQEAAAAHGIDILLHTHRQSHHQDDLYNKLRDGRVDGLFVFALPNNDLVHRLASSSLKAVSIAEAVPELPSVVCDDVGGMRKLLKYLWAQGHRRIGFLAPSECYISVERRLKSFHRYLEERDVPEENRPVFRAEQNGETSFEAWKKIPALRRPTAICCWNDDAAYWFLAQCFQSGIKVPDDVAVTGFDGFLARKLPSRHLVTIDCQWTNVSTLAMENMVKLLQGEEVAPEECLPVKFVAGDTA